MSAKHTPGPWEWRSTSVLIPIAPYEYAEAYGGTQANARLIAAAPELLEALQAFSDVYGGDDVPRWMKVLQQARAAIEKATGEKQ